MFWQSYWLNIGIIQGDCRVSQGAPQVKNLPAMWEMQEMRVRSLGWKVTLEEGMATHSSILAWRFPWTEEPGGLQSVGLQRIGRH